MPKEFTGKKVMGAFASPVVLVTASYNGKSNITTVSMVAGISFSPLLVCASLSHRSFTRNLVDESREFAINFISHQQLELAKKVGATSGHNIDKLKEFNVVSIPGKRISCPIIKVAHTALECIVKDVINLGKHNLYIAEVVTYHEFGTDSPLYLYHGYYYSSGEKIAAY